MFQDCQACDDHNYSKRKFDARYYNPDPAKPKLRQFGMNERNLTSEQLVQLGPRSPQKQRRVRKIGGPSPYERSDIR